MGWRAKLVLILNCLSLRRLVFIRKRSRERTNVKLRLVFSNSEAVYREQQGIPFYRSKIFALGPSETQLSMREIQMKTLVNWIFGRCTLLLMAVALWFFFLARVPFFLWEQPVSFRTKELLLFQPKPGFSDF